eukprot:2588129-Alexandrium_andersonii.AAC.1
MADSESGHRTVATIPESGYPSMAVHAGSHILAPPRASGVLWAKHNILHEPRFGPRDLPCFG